MKNINKEELKKAKALLRYAREVTILDISALIFFTMQYSHAEDNNNSNEKVLNLIFMFISCMMINKITEERKIAKEEVKRLKK